MNNTLDFIGIKLNYSDEVFRPTLISENCAKLTDFRDKLTVLDNASENLKKQKGIHC